MYQKSIITGRQRLMPVILATWEDEIRITGPGQHRQIVHKTISKISTTKWT
jgi:hypothetical protein